MQWLTYSFNLSFRATKSLKTPRISNLCWTTMKMRSRKRLWKRISRRHLWNVRNWYKFIWNWIYCNSSGNLSLEDVSADEFMETSSETYSWKLFWKFISRDEFVDPFLEVYSWKRFWKTDLEFNSWILPWKCTRREKLLEKYLWSRLWRWIYENFSGNLFKEMLRHMNSCKTTL